MHACPRADDVFKTERLAVFDELVEFRFQFSERVMRADALEAGFLESVAEVGALSYRSNRRLRLLCILRRELVKVPWKFLGRKSRTE